jgi:hypothetical protein
MKKIQTVKIGEKLFLAGECADGTVAGYAMMLNEFSNLVEAGTYVLAMGEGTPYALKGRERYECQLRMRVGKHLRAMLDKIARDQNKKMKRRYVHWSNCMGRFFDEGE